MATSGLDVLFEASINALTLALDKSVQVAMKEYEKLQQTGLKGELTDIYISFLRSSVLNKLPWLRIDLYDAAGRTDPTECCADFDTPFISDRIYIEAEKLKKERHWRSGHQERQAWLNASDKCAKMFERHLPQVINESETAKMANCRWLFGQFLGNAVVVRERGNSVE